MPNVAAALKSEIARVARKHLRVELGAVRKALQSQRAAIRQQRALLEALERQVAALRRLPESTKPERASVDGPARRFSAARFRGMRARLELSAAQCGAILGVSAQTVYAWERGAARPAVEKLESIAALRGLGKRALAAKLAAMQ